MRWTETTVSDATVSPEFSGRTGTPAPPVDACRDTALPGRTPRSACGDRANPPRGRDFAGEGPGPRWIGPVAPPRRRALPQTPASLDAPDSWRVFVNRPENNRTPPRARDDGQRDHGERAPRPSGGPRCAASAGSRPRRPARPSVWAPRLVGVMKSMDPKRRAERGTTAAAGLGGVSTGMSAISHGMPVLTPAAFASQTTRGRTDWTSRRGSQMSPTRVWGLGVGGAGMPPGRHLITKRAQKETK